MWPGLLALVSIGAVAADQGGYFPTTWGWTSLAFLWVAGLTIVLRQTVRVSKAEALFLFAWAALLAWIALSTLWSTDLSETVLEVERTLVYVSAAAMFVLVCTGRSQRPLLGGLLCAIGAVSLFSLGTRLFPNVLRVYDPTAAKRLAEPLGYWNGLSAFTALGAVLAFGFAAHGRTLAVRAAAAALLVPLLATFYFTFGRSGWVALTAGFLVCLGLDRRPLRPLALLVALAPLLALDVWLSSRRPGLTDAHASLARAARDGHALALRLVILGLAAATVVAAFWVVERRITFPRSVKIAFALLLAVACMAGAAVVFSSLRRAGVADAACLAKFQSATVASGEPQQSSVHSLEQRPLPALEDRVWTTPGAILGSVPAPEATNATSSAISPHTWAASATPTACTWRHSPSSDRSGWHC